MFISLCLTFSLHLWCKSHHLVFSFHIQQFLFIPVSEREDLTNFDFFTIVFFVCFFVIFYDFYD